MEPVRRPDEVKEEAERKVTSLDLAPEVAVSVRAAEKRRPIGRERRATT